MGGAGAGPALRRLSWVRARGEGGLLQGAAESHSLVLLPIHPFIPSRARPGKPPTLQLKGLSSALGSSEGNSPCEPVGLEPCLGEAEAVGAQVGSLCPREPEEGCPGGLSRRQA